MLPRIRQSLPALLGLLTLSAVLGIVYNTASPLGVRPEPPRMTTMPSAPAAPATSPAVPAKGKE